jgi:hypothetical protein
MIRLHPEPGVAHLCPHCREALTAKDWWIPGMRMLAVLDCPRCSRRFYGDLPAGHGLYYPMLLEVKTGEVHDAQGVPWFADSLRDSFARRIDEPMPFAEEESRPIRKPLLLNCLDQLYGHSLLKLLNAQYYLDHHPDQDLIVLIPRFLRWLVPQGVAAIWTVSLPLRKGNTWNDWLAKRLHEKIDPFADASLSVAFSHPNPDDFAIERFSGIAPFDTARWAELLAQRPTVTFIWRDDRLWEAARSRVGTKLRRLRNQAERTVLGAQSGATTEARPQERLVAQLALRLRQSFPRMEFAVAGLGQRGRLAEWISDMRESQVNESTERAWCQRYADSHLVIGVHGSNMLLPSAHAGAVLELLPSDRWGNLLQEILPRTADPRDALLRVRFLPLASNAATVAEAAAALLQDVPIAGLNYNRPWCDHKTVTSQPGLLAQKRLEMIGLLRAAQPPPKE